MLDPKVEARIMAALNHEEGDRVPIWDYLDNKDIIDHLCPGWTSYDEAIPMVYEKLNIDICRGYGQSYDESDDGTTFENEEGNTRAKITGRSHWQVDYPIKTLEDLKTYNLNLLPDQAYTDWALWQKTFVDRMAPHTMYVPGMGCGFHASYGLMGQEFFSYAIYDDPNNVERIIELNTEHMSRYTKAATDLNFCPMFFIGDDIAYKGALLYSPEFLKKTFIKSLKKCCDIVHANGQKVIFHSDGYVMEILDEMVDAGIDGLNPIEPLAGMDIGLIKKRYGKNLVLVGNVDCSQVLPRGSVDEVIAATKQCLKDAAPGGGHFIGSSSEIVPCTPVENILAFYETCVEFGKYPIRV